MTFYFLFCNKTFQFIFLFLAQTQQFGGPWRQLWYSDFEEFQRLTEPSFDNNTMSNITVQLGGTAFLHCRVRNLGERTVSAEVSIAFHSISQSINQSLSFSLFILV